MNFALLNNIKDLDPSYRMDLDFLDCFGRGKPLFIAGEIRYLSTAHSRHDGLDIIPPLPKIANFSTKHFILSKVYTYEGGIK